MNIADTLESLKRGGNFRSIPIDMPDHLVDLTSNDYLGLAARDDLREAFFDDPATRSLAMTSSASRLLAAAQGEYSRMENMLSELYSGREALLFNSGYHANTGLIPAVTDPADTVILADRLVHASIIDGIRLSRCRFERWRHNDYAHLERLLRKYESDASVSEILIVAESIYSMDGDSADISQLAYLRDSVNGAVLYVDEAHAIGVAGPSGLGLAAGLVGDGLVDILVGTFGKALASVGAFAVMGPGLRDIAVNRARSLIFSTSLPPLNVAWTRFMFEKALGMDSERSWLRELTADVFGFFSGLELPCRVAAPSHIMPVVVGDAARAVALSEQLLGLGVKALPIRTPAVPAGTERLRLSFSAALTGADVALLKDALTRLFKP